MRWHERLYMGERAKKRRYPLIQAVRERRRWGYYVVTTAFGGKNLLELIPASSFSQDFYHERDYLIVGLASDYQDAAELSGKILTEIYQKTGDFDTAAFFSDRADSGFPSKLQL